MNRKQCLSALFLFLAICGLCRYSYWWIEQKRMQKEEERVNAILDSFYAEVPETFEYSKSRLIRPVDYLKYDDELGEKPEISVIIPSVSLDSVGKRTLIYSLDIVDSYQRQFERNINSGFEVVDTQAPEITLTDEKFSIYVKGKYSYGDWIESVKDPVDGELELCEDNAEGQGCWWVEDTIDINKKGEYELTVKAKDIHDNVSEKKFTVEVKPRPVSSGKSAYVDFDAHFSIVDGHQAEIDAGYLTRFMGDYWHHNWASFMKYFWRMGKGTTVKMDGVLWNCLGIERCSSDNATGVFCSGGNVAFDNTTQIITCATNDGYERYVAFLERQ